MSRPRRWAPTRDEEAAPRTGAQSKDAPRVAADNGNGGTCGRRGPPGGATAAAGRARRGARAARGGAAGLPPRRLAAAESRARLPPHRAKPSVPHTVPNRRWRRGAWRPRRRWHRRDGPPLADTAPRGGVSAPAARTRRGVVDAPCAQQPSGRGRDNARGAGRGCRRGAPPPPPYQSLPRGRPIPQCPQRSLSIAVRLARRWINASTTKAGIRRTILAMEYRPAVWGHVFTPPCRCTRPAAGLWGVALERRPACTLQRGGGGE